MAYVVTNLSDSTIEPLFKEHGPMPHHIVMSIMPEEDRAKWEQVEDISKVVCETYGVTYDEFWDQVQGTILMNDLASQSGLQ